MEKFILQQDFNGSILYRRSDGRYEVDGKVFTTTQQAFDSTKGNNAKLKEAQDTQRDTAGNPGSKTQKK